MGVAVLVLIVREAAPCAADCSRIDLSNIALPFHTRWLAVLDAEFVLAFLRSAAPDWSHGSEVRRVRLPIVGDSVAIERGALHAEQADFLIAQYDDGNGSGLAEWWRSSMSIL